MTCPGCGHEPTKVVNTYPGKVVERRHVCLNCGRRWKSKQRVIRGSLVLPAITNSNVRAISSKPNSNVDISISDQRSLPESEPESTLRSHSDQTRARVRAVPAPSYEAAYLPIWAATGKRGDKFKGQQSWIKRGRPTLETVQTKWTQYLESLESWRNPKDLSTWFNNWGHTHEYEPAAPEPEKKAPVSFAVAAEQGRVQRALHDKLKRIQGELSPVKQVDPRAEYAASVGGQK